MVEVLQKYRTVLIILVVAALIALTILLITLANKKTEKIPLRGVFVKNVSLMEVEEAAASLRI
ncbi:MAG TPA: hypothetical protein GX527_07780 [Clostridiaceae bacterium]|jgi:hypothetical protein|nr:hypothetical protein [Clostridiaceae bacterium]